MRGFPCGTAHCELEGFGLTAKWRNASLERAKSISERYAREYPPSTPFGLLFMGPPGVGKTHLAVGIIRKLIRDKSVPCLFRTFPDLLKEIQMSYSPISMSSELSLLSPVLESEVLMLDELGAQTPSAWVKETVCLHSQLPLRREQSHDPDHELPGSGGPEVPAKIGQLLVDRAHRRTHAFAPI